MGLTVIYLSLILLFIALVISRYVEGFGSTSPGTLLQLASSHVPTEEDVYFYKYVYPRMVNRDLIAMTGSGL